ncbi:hypothetical protein BDF21DRAFT_425816 [Thamnidium elegans]|nr:hypothetical protein BDF21DRAFT_425816 [Thamnidium elegans]
MASKRYRPDINSLLEDFLIGGAPKDYFFFQDAVIMVRPFPQHLIFKNIIFTDPLFIRFKR